MALSGRRSAASAPASSGRHWATSRRVNAAVASASAALRSASASAVLVAAAAGSRRSGSSKTCQRTVVNDVAGAGRVFPQLGHEAEAGPRSRPRRRRSAAPVNAPGPGRPTGSPAAGSTSRISSGCSFASIGQRLAQRLIGPRAGRVGDDVLLVAGDLVGDFVVGDQAGAPRARPRGEPGRPARRQCLRRGGAGHGSQGTADPSGRGEYLTALYRRSRCRGYRSISCRGGAMARDDADFDRVLATGRQGPWVRAGLGGRPGRARALGGVRRRPRLDRVDWVDMPGVFAWRREPPGIWEMTWQQTAHGREMFELRLMPPEHSMVWRRQVVDLLRDLGAGARPRCRPGRRDAPRRRCCASTPARPPCGSRAHRPVPPARSAAGAGVLRSDGGAVRRRL